MRTFWFTAVFILLFSGIASGQAPSTIMTGRVVDRDSQKPVRSASVWGYDADGKLAGVKYTAADGSFAWKIATPGKYKLVFQADGYRPDSLVAEAVKWETTQVGVIKLTAVQVGKEMAMDTVVVKMQLPIEQYADRLVYDVSRDPDAKKMKMTEIMEKIPALSSTNAAGKLEYAGVMVGQVLIDGEPHEFINVATQFPMRMIRGDVMGKIEVIPPGSPQYNNDQPIVNIITDRPLPNGVAVEITGSVRTDNFYGGGVNFVSKIRDKVVLRLGYDIDYGSAPKLSSHSLREQLADGVATSSLESYSTAWNDATTHNFLLRGSTQLLKRKFDFGFKTSLGERNSYSELQSTTTDAQGNAAILNSGTKNGSNTIPTFSGDLRYTINRSRKRMTHLTYQYTDNRSRTLREQTTNDPAFAGGGLDSRSDDGSRAHVAYLFHRDNFNEKHSLGNWATYTNRFYDYQTVYDPLSHSASSLDGMTYRQQVADLISRYTFTTKKITASGGLQGAYERDKGTFLSTSSPLDYSQFSLSPSASLQWRVSSDYFMGANYTSRKVRPSFTMLDPYVNTADPQNISMGNPDLKPEFLQMASLDARRQIGKPTSAEFKGSVGLGVSYRLITDAIEQVTSVPGGGVSVTTYENIGKRKQIRISTEGVILLQKKIQIQAWAGYNFYFYDSPNPDIPDGPISGWDCMVFADGSLWKGSSTRITYRLQSNLNASQANEVFYTHTFNFEHTQTVLKNKLFASVRISNPLKSRMTVRNSIEGANFRMTSEREQMGRVFEFSLRFNFGRLKDRVADAEKMRSDTSRD